MTIFLEDSREFRETKSSMRLDKNKYTGSKLFLPVTHLEKYSLKIFPLVIKSLIFLTMYLIRKYSTLYEENYKGWLKGIKF